VSAAVIVGVGARTAIGLGAAQTAFLYRASAYGMREAPLADENGEPVTLCYLPTIDPRLTGAARAVKLAVPALEEALDALGPAAREMRLGLGIAADEWLGSPGYEGRAAAASLAGEIVAGAREKLGTPASLETSARGPAAPGFLIPGMLDALARGAIDAAILGGAHTDYDPARVLALADSGRLFRPGNAEALIPGEAAAFAVLMRPEVARRFRIEPRAELHTVATAFEKARPDNDEPAFEAAGLTVAVRRAGAPLTDGRRRAGWMLTDLGHETQRLFEIQAMSVRTRHFWCEPQLCDAPAQRLGYLGAATMPLHLALAAEGFRRGIAPHPWAMSMAGSDAGERAAMLLSAPGA
jgi:3-oxoacyl-[acyl-carrier-protein] synthase I